MYKHAIKEAQRTPKQVVWNRLHSELESNETNEFWRSWRSLYNKKSKQFAAVVNGCSSKEAIAEEFKKSFQANAQPNNQSKVDDLDQKFKLKYHEYSISHDKSCSCMKHDISLHVVFDAIAKMRKGKCPDGDEICAEHFHNAPLILLQRLASLFNSMMRHSFVPKQFRFSFMIPIIKDNNGNHSDVANYRGITISPIISKILEHCLKAVYSNHLSTSPHQFGFKGKSSTAHAVFCLRETVDFYTKNNSRVYCSFLDASKAFDRLVHSGLFLKLMERNVSKILLDILITWHDGLYCQVKWNGVYSGWFPITAGVRQGGVLSPDLYCIYVDKLISVLQSLNIGCYIKNVFAAALFYADDMAILAPSLKGLQKLLDACAAYCIEWDIKLNATKTKNLFFGKGSAPSHLLHLNNSEIKWDSKCAYLGVTLVSGRVFGCCIKETLKKFYRCLNAIIRIEGRSDDMVMLRLLEAHCIPILTYATETIHVVNRDDRRQMRVAYNSVYRKLFGYSYRESVTILQHSLKRFTWEELIENRKSSFIDRCRLCSYHSLVGTCVRINH